MIIKPLPQSNAEIKSIEDWFKLCPPAKGEEHWKDKRSAKELARYWTDKNKQNEFFKFIECSVGIKCEDIMVFPEYKTRFDNYGKNRQNDLMILCKHGLNDLLITVEAKVYESFNEYIGKVMKSSVYKKIENSNSKSLNRLIDLWDAIVDRSDEYLNLRYQLIYWVAGTLSEASRRNIKKTLCIVQEFVSDEIDLEKKQVNKNDLNKFIEIISKKKYNSIKNKEILGPFFVRGNDFIPSNVGLYIGKLECNI